MVHNYMVFSKESTCILTSGSVLALCEKSWNGLGYSSACLKRRKHSEVNVMECSTKGHLVRLLYYFYKQRQC